MFVASQSQSLENRIDAMIAQGEEEERAEMAEELPPPPPPPRVESMDTGTMREEPSSSTSELQVTIKNPNGSEKAEKADRKVTVPAHYHRVEGALPKATPINNQEVNDRAAALQRRWDARDYEPCQPKDKINDVMDKFAAQFHANVTSPQLPAQPYRELMSKTTRKIGESRKKEELAQTKDQLPAGYQYTKEAEKAIDGETFSTVIRDWEDLCLDADVLTGKTQRDPDSMEDLRLITNNILCSTGIPVRYPQIPAVTRITTVEEWRNAAKSMQKFVQESPRQNPFLSINEKEDRKSVV